jgi:very-short-patch-repair endonuclease
MIVTPGWDSERYPALMGHRPRRIELARKLRRESTEVEEWLWQELRDRRLSGHRFRRQHPLGTYVLDFYCPSARLCVEVDGSGHLDCRADDRRTAWLATQGIRVIRFWDHEVSNQREHVLQAIADAIDDRLR